MISGLFKSNSGKIWSKVGDDEGTGTRRTSRWRRRRTGTMSKQTTTVKMSLLSVILHTIRRLLDWSK
ncbi:unnamed protein product, partial [Nesidiocoris tenuis]